MGKLTGKVAVITGGTRGFGFAVAQAYIHEGAVVVVGSRSSASVAQAVHQLEVVGGQASGIPVDVANFEQVRDLANHAKEKFGGFDIWLNNAAISAPYGPTVHIRPEDFRSVIETNIFGVYNGSRIALEHFIPRGRGKLINLLGRGSRGPQPMQNAYASSKAWVHSFTNALAKEQAGSGVGIFAFNPGMMDTDLLLDVEVVEGYESRLDALDVVMRMFSKPPEIPAQKAVWLASSETDGKTGLEIHELGLLGMLSGALREGARRLTGNLGSKYDIQVSRVPSGFSEDENLGG